MKRNALLLTLLVVCSLCMAEQYKLIKGCVYYRSGENVPETKVMPNQYIPSADVYVRMHKDSRNDDTFEVSNSEGERFVGRAPKSWPGKKLSDCLRREEEQDKDNQFAVANAIPMGDAEIKRVSQFHYLCAFVSQFDDPHWRSFPYSPKDSANMQKAIDKVRSQQEYLKGKQYLLTTPRTTKSYIVNCMDSILQNVGENDFVFLYLSSHGEKDNEGQFHFVTKDSRQNASGKRFSNTLTKSEINHYVNQLTAKRARVLFFLDACYAGSVLDNEIRGEAAYYLSTNGENPAYYNKLFGSPFALALMEVMSGSLNENYIHCFTDNKVQVGSLGNYLSTAVYGKGQHQHPVCNEHALSPAYVLWQIRDSKPQESLTIRLLTERAEKNPEDMIKLGDRYYKGEGVEVDFYKAFDCYKTASEKGKKNVKADALQKMSDCFYFGKPESDAELAFEYALQAAQLGNIIAMRDVANYYYNGYGTTKNPKEYIRWYQLAARKGDRQAQNNLGVCYELGNGVAKDYKKAVYWYTKSAEQGYVSAQNNLADCYQNGTGVDKSYQTAAHWYAQAAEQGNARAQFNVAYFYDQGLGVAKNMEKAVYWYTKAAEQGNASAQCNLGLCYENGTGLPVDYKKASYWYRKAAENGNISAQCYLGEAYYSGQGEQKDYEQAVYWFAKSAEQGFARAQHYLGICYEFGYGVAEEESKAVYWYTKSAEQGYAMAQCNLGYCYEAGEGVEKNLKTAVSWYTKAARQGNKRAQNNLGVCYEYGNGVEKNLKTAVYWYTKAAEKGFARAQCNLGYCYEFGNGVTKDYKKAAYWYNKAAEQGFARAQYNLGDCYYQGNGVTKDYEKAVYWFTKAADQGNASAQNYLGVCNEYGKGMTKDVGKAFYWYTKAAENGNVTGQCNLGLCYEYGTGVAKDMKRAVSWYTKAAEAGNARAQYYLGICYENGTGVKKDTNKAVYWFTKAADQGYEKAKKKLTKDQGTGASTTSATEAIAALKGNYVNFVYRSYDDNTSFYLRGDTTQKAEPGAVGSTYLLERLKEEKRAKTGALSSVGKGMFVYGTNGYYQSYIPREFSDTLSAVNNRGKTIIDVAMSNNMKYYCVVYDKNKYFTNGPVAFKNTLKEYSDANEEFLSVSVNDAGEFAVVTNKHYYCSNPSTRNFAEQIQKNHGYIYSINISNKGVAICTADGVYFEKLPPEVYHAMTRALDFSNPFNIKVVKFTDAGTCLVTDGKSQYTYRL